MAQLTDTTHTFTDAKSFLLAPAHVTEYILSAANTTGTAAKKRKNKEE